MKRKILCAIICLSTLLGIMCGCNKKAGKNELSLNTDATLGTLKWGMTQDEAKEAFDKLGNIEADNRYITVSGVKLFGKDAQVNLQFYEYSKADYPMLDEDTPLLLSGMNVVISNAEKDTVIQNISEVLGEQETKQIGFYDNDGDYGIDRSSDLQEDRRYWHSEKNLLDIFGMEQLRKMLPELNEKEITRKMYNTYEYIVHVYGGEDTNGLEKDQVLIEISGDASVIRQIYENEI